MTNNFEGPTKRESIEDIDDYAPISKNPEIDKQEKDDIEKENDPEVLSKMFESFRDKGSLNEDVVFEKILNTVEDPEVLIKILTRRFGISTNLGEASESKKMRLINTILANPDLTAKQLREVALAAPLDSELEENIIKRAEDIEN